MIFNINDIKVEVDNILIHEFENVSGIVFDEIEAKGCLAGENVTTKEEIEKCIAETLKEEIELFRDEDLLITVIENKINTYG